MAANVEQATVFYGGVYGDEGHNITGNALANFIGGDYGGNTISGGDGDDTIFGSTGAATFFQFGTDGDVLSGDNGNDFLYGGAGDDTLNGGAGNDMLYGASGNDLMTGGAGNDLYHVDSGDGGAAGGDLGTEDRIVELAGGGTDTVEIFRNHPAYTLPDQVENLHVIGSGTAITATGNGLANVFDIDQAASGDNLNGLGGSDTLNIGAIANAADPSVTTAGFEAINIEASLVTDADWTLNAGDVAGQVVRINGSIGDTSSVVVNGLNASHTVILGDADQLQGFTTGTVSLGLQNDGGGDDDLNIVLGGSVFNILLASNGEEHLNFEVRNTFNSVNVANVVGEDDFYFSGSGRDVTVSGLDLASVIRLQNLEVVNFTSTLASDAGGADSLTLEIDNVVIGDPNDGGLFTSAAMETLNIDTRGDDPFDNGASYIDGSGINTTATDVVLTGGQNLTVFDFGGDDFNASGFTGDLSGSFGAGATILTAGTGIYVLNMGAGIDELVFGTTLNGADSIHGGTNAGDILSASFNAGTHVLHISEVENLDFTLLAGGAYTFDLGEIEDGSALVDIDLLGDTTANVTFVLPDFVGTDAGYNINASGFTTGTLNATTGTRNDVLVGGDGNDTFRGGSGSDTLTGDLGADSFVFDSLTGIDTITDFTAGTDKITLSLGIFGEVGTVGAFDAATFVTAAGVPAAAAANDHVLYNSTTGALFYDPDGDGGTAMIQFATLTGNPALTAADFTVVS
jgi:Ca2+-binding RTX toxin-like protein